MIDVDSIRKQSWDRATDAFGTAYIFERRARRLHRSLRILTFVGLLPAVVVGAFALSFGLIAIVVTVAAAVGIIQVVVSLWALVDQWVDKHAYAVESVAVNNRLSSRFSDLARNPPPNPQQLHREFESIKVDDEHRRDLDIRRNISEKERRRGMRAALRQFHRPCAECHKVPASMQATDCGVCGSF